MKNIFLILISILFFSCKKENSEFAGDNIRFYVDCKNCYIEHTLPDGTTNIIDTAATGINQTFKFKKGDKVELFVYAYNNHYFPNLVIYGRGTDEYVLASQKAQNTFFSNYISAEAP